MVRLTDRPNMTLDVNGGRKTTIQQQQILKEFSNACALCVLVHLHDFLTFYARETTFVTSCLLFWAMQPFQNRVYS